ncbi:Glucose-6-phosphate 1-dehydrogenase [compost metagenome]
MKEKSTRIVIEFKEPFNDSNNLNKGNDVPNLLIIEIGPNEAITLQLNTKDQLQKGKLEPVRATYEAGTSDVPEAYENLIFDALRGDATFFAHWREVELSWQWVTPIQEAMEEGLMPLHTYASGSYGPDAAMELLGEDRWWFDEADQETEVLSAQAEVAATEESIRPGA